MADYPTIGETLEQTVSRHPDNDAIVYPHKDQRWTYDEFNERVNRLANAMSDLGIEKGDRVATVLYNGSEIALTVYACAKLGAVFTPLNFRLPAGEIEYIVNDAEAEMVVYESDTRTAVESARPELGSVDEFVFIDEDVPDGARGFYDLLESGAPEPPDVVVDENDVYAFIYTSGTTGRPKGVVHHEFEPRPALEAIERHDVTLLFAAPTAWHALARTAAETEIDVSSLERGLYGAAPMPEEVLNMSMEHLCEDYVQAYGMTEIGPCGVFQPPEDQLPKQGCAGLPAPNHEVRVVDPGAAPDEEVEQGDLGEIIIAGPCTMREYWNRPEATAQSLREADGSEWYYSGDIGYFDEDGYLYHVDRKDDMIISGGENIYPTAVEDVLFSHDGIEEAAVLGEPDETWGERVVAYIVGGDDLTAAELDEFVRESDRLADFKRPRAYYFVDSVPKNPSGKVQKFKLRDGIGPDSDPEPIPE